MYSFLFYYTVTLSINMITVQEENCRQQCNVPHPQRRTRLPPLQSKCTNLLLLLHWQRCNPLHAQCQVAWIHILLWQDGPHKHTLPHALHSIHLNCATVFAVCMLRAIQSASRIYWSICYRDWAKWWGQDPFGFYWPQCRHSFNAR